MEGALEGKGAHSHCSGSLRDTAAREQLHEDDACTDPACSDPRGLAGWLRTVPVQPEQLGQGTETGRGAGPGRASRRWWYLR